MKIVVATALFLVAFVALRHANPTGIVFYQGLALALAVSAVFAVDAKWRQQQPWVMAFKDTLLVFLLAYAFMFTIPTTVDRAYSVRLILEVDRAPQGLSEAEIEAWFARDFGAAGGVAKRLHEQQVTGTLRRREDGRFELTDRGHGMAAAFRWLRRAFANSDAAAGASSAVGGPPAAAPGMNR